MNDNLEDFPGLVQSRYIPAYNAVSEPTPKPASDLTRWFDANPPRTLTPAEVVKARKTMKAMMGNP